jgi:putative ABC transport system permease protein
MNRERLLRASERWFRLLTGLYSPDFRDDMGDGVVETYRDRANEALDRGGVFRLAGVWLRALVDALRNGPGDRARPAAWWRRGGNWGRDVELASRRLRRSPGFVLAMVGTLTVGLGTFAVVYTFVQKILIEPMPYRNPGDLYFVWRDYRAFFDLDRGWLAGTDVAELARAGGPIEDAAGMLRQLVTFSAREGADATEISVISTSPNLFDLLGVAPAIGRGFARDEVGPKRPPVIVLTHALWNRLGADPAILGSHVRLNGEPYTVIGVMPPSFAFVRNASLGPPQPADAYTTLSVHLRDTNPNAGSYAGLVRARRGTPPETVAAAVSAVGRIVDVRDSESRGLKLYPTGLQQDLVSSIRPALLVLGLAGVVLVLALLVNLGSVLLARAAQREHEFAVSRALGADGVAVARATLFEGGLLGLAGGIAGSAAAIWGTQMLIALAPLTLPRRQAIAVDWQIAVVVTGVGTLLGLLAAAAPAIWSARAKLSTLLASSAVRGGGGHARMRRSLVVAQVALSLVLLSSAGLVARSFARMLRADAGFKPEGLLTLRVPMPAQLFPKPEDAYPVQARIEDALAAIPGVTRVSAASALPLLAAAGQQTIRIPSAPGNTGNKDRDTPLVDVIGVRAGYVETIGMRLVEGRAFEQARRPEVREAVIDTQLARQFFPGASPLGAMIPFGDKQSLTIVGVMEQARLYDAHQDGRPQLFVRVEDWGYRTVSFVIRSDRDPATLVPDVRAAVRQVDARLALANVKTMDEIVQDALRQQRLSAMLIAGFAFGALLLAAMGLFGVVSGSVTRRRHELAVRLALGATRRRILGLVFGEGATLVGLGLLLGVPGIYFAGGLIRGVLVGVSPLDPLTLVTVSAGLMLVAMMACFFPARRALRIDPARSLRQE